MVTASVVVKPIDSITLFTPDACLELWEKRQLHPHVYVSMTLVFYKSKTLRHRSWYEDTVLHVVDKVVTQDQQPFSSGRGAQYVSLCGFHSNHAVTLAEHARMWIRTTVSWRLCKHCVRPAR